MSVITPEIYKVILRPEAARVAGAETEIKKIARMGEFDAHATMALLSLGKATPVAMGTYEYAEFVCEQLNLAGLPSEFEKVQ